MPFKKGHKKIGGRKPATENKIPKLVKDCVILAAELEGSNQNGKDGMVGFLRHVAREDLSAFASLLRFSMGTQTENRNDVRQEVVYQTVEEVQRELASRGISIEVIARIADRRPKMVDGIELIDDGEIIDVKANEASNGSGGT